MNFLVYVSLWIYLRAKYETIESWVIRILLEICWTNFYFNWQCIKVPLFLLMSEFKVNFCQFHSVEMVCCLIHISLIFSEIKMLFMCLLAMCIPIGIGMHSSPMWTGYSLWLLYYEVIFFLFIYIDSDY